MVIGVLEIELFLPGAQSLKEKRMVLRSLKTRIRNTFNVSVSELDNNDKWQRAVLGVVSIGNGKSSTDSYLSGILDFVDRERTLEVIKHSIALL